MILFLFSWVFIRYKYGNAIFSNSRPEKTAIAYEPEMLPINPIMTNPKPSKADINAVILAFTSSFFTSRSCDLDLSVIVGLIMQLSWNEFRDLNWLKTN